MRRSRLYLTLSIISMIAAVGVGIGQSRCRGHCPITECSIIPTDHQSRAMNALQTRDFQAMLKHADALIDQGDKVDGRRLKAYALRGQGDLDNAIAAYHESMHRESGEEVERPVLIDAYVGLADCFARLGLKERARDWIGRAEEEAVTQLAEGADRHSLYQMACVLAVRSSIEEGRVAKVYRGFAIEQLTLAIERGFDSWDHMRGDIDLDALRGEPQFQALFPPSESGVVPAPGSTSQSGH